MRSFSWMLLLVFALLGSLPAKGDVAASHYQRAMALKKKGDLDGAIVALRQALGQREDYVAAHYSLGVLLRQKKQLKKALSHLSRAAKLDADSAKVQYSLALTYHQLGKRGEAIRAMRRAAARDPKDPRALAQLGVLLMRVDPEGAIKSLRTALKLEPNHPEHLHHLGVAYRRASAKVSDDGKKKKYLTQAEHFLLRAHELEASAAINFDLGVLYRRQKQFTKAIRYYEAAVDLDPKRVSAWWDLGHCYSQANRPDEAIRAYRRFSKLERDKGKTKIARERIERLKSLPQPAVR